MVGIEYLVPLNHRYRRVVQIWRFNKVEKQLTKITHTKDMAYEDCLNVSYYNREPRYASYLFL